MPRYHPPSGFTPSALRYIYEMGHDKKAFSAAIINLAVMGYNKISEGGTNYELHKLKNAGIKLPAGEHAVLSNLFDGHNTKLLLKNKTMK